MVVLNYLVLIIIVTCSANALTSPWSTMGRRSFNSLENKNSRQNVGSINRNGYLHREFRLEAKKSIKANKDDNDGNDKKTGTTKMSPGTLIAAPFVVLVGVDIALNIGVLVKRTVEYFVFGKLPSTEVWFSDNLFL